MGWHTMSLDEFESTQAEFERLKIDAPRKAVMLLEACIENLVSKLGVDPSAPESIAYQQELLGINVYSMGEEELRKLIIELALNKGRAYTYNPEALGFYIYHHGKPKFFIPEPVVDTFTGRVIARFYSFDENVQIDDGSFLMVFE